MPPGRLGETARWMLVALAYVAVCGGLWVAVFELYWQNADIFTVLQRITHRSLTLPAQSQLPPWRVRMPGEGPNSPEERAGPR